MARYNKTARHKASWNKSLLSIIGDASTDSWLIALFLRGIRAEALDKKTEALYSTRASHAGYHEERDISIVSRFNSRESRS